MMIHPKDPGGIWRYYLEHSKVVAELYDYPKILKADADNEAKCIPLPGGIAGNIKDDVTCIEIDKQTVDKAKMFLPNKTIIQGDIRRISFKDGTFDIVIDLSTLDHVRNDEVDMVIGEYHRVLKKNGHLLLIAWFGDLYTSNVSRNKSFDVQYYFWEPDVQISLDKYFIIKDSEKFFDENYRYLKRFFGTRR